MTAPINGRDDVSAPSSPLPPTPREPETKTDPRAAAEHRPKPPSSPYTLLATPQRTLISVIAGLATMFSPLTANIYLPCLPFNSPILFSQLSEKLGRRPVHLLTFSIFAAAECTLPAPVPPAQERP